MTVTALTFAEQARRLGGAARANGLVVPAFRAPPSTPGLRRDVRRYEGGAVVGVVLKDRPVNDVLADMVWGVLFINGRIGDSALRDALVEAAS